MAAEVAAAAGRLVMVGMRLEPKIKPAGPPVLVGAPLVAMAAGPDSLNPKLARLRAVAAVVVPRRKAAARMAAPAAWS